MFVLFVLFGFVTPLVVTVSYLLHLLLSLFALVSIQDRKIMVQEENFARVDREEAAAFLLINVSKLRKQPLTVNRACWRRHVLQSELKQVGEGAPLAEPEVCKQEWEGLSIFCFFLTSFR